jgi:hypothetical protein
MKYRYRTISKVRDLLINDHKENTSMSLVEFIAVEAANLANYVNKTVVLSYANAYEEFSGNIKEERTLIGGKLEYFIREETVYKSVAEGMPLEDYKWTFCIGGKVVTVGRATDGEKYIYAKIRVMPS